MFLPARRNVCSYHVATQREARQDAGKKAKKTKRRTTVGTLNFTGETYLFTNIAHT